MRLSSLKIGLESSAVRKRLDTLGRCVAGLALALALPCVAAQPGANETQQPLVFSNATVVDVRNGSLRENASIVIQGNVIVSVSQQASPSDFEGMEVVDLRGGYVIPGFLEMHAHPLNDLTGYKQRLALMLANGITGFRQMSGYPQLLALRASGELIPPEDAPELLATAGRVLTSDVFQTPEQAEEEVRRQQAEGVDFIKEVALGGPALFATIAEAHKLGLPVAGHIEPTIPIDDVLAAGMDSIEHLGPDSALLLGCSSEEARLREELASAPLRPAVDFSDKDMAAFIKRFTTNPIVFDTPAEYSMMRQLIETYDEEKCRALARRMAASTTWQVPTLIRIRTMQLSDAPEYAADPNLRYIDPAERKIWSEMGAKYISDISAQNKQTLRDFFELQLKLTKLMADNQVKMMAASDEGGIWVVPGFGLHQEFDLLAEAGLTPLQILQMATLNGAVFEQREETLGGVEGGKLANLVVLRGNPLDDVQNLHAIEGVVNRGKYYDRPALDALLEQSEFR